MNTSLLIQKFKSSLSMKHLNLIFAAFFVILSPKTSDAQIDCNTIMACNDYVQVSLGTNCTEVVVADMILEAQTYSNSNYNVVTTNANGSIVTNNVLTKAHIGKTLSVSVTLDGCDLSCWGYITVEDKLAPVISNCPSATVECGQATTPGTAVPKPTATDACSTVTLTSSDKEVVSQCTAQYVKVITRTWTATDLYGNKSTCQQTINVIRPTIDDVNFPPNYDDIDKPVFSCDTNIKLLPNGAPHPDVTGYPGGTDCPNIMYFYNDVIFPICGASRKVLRQWTVIDWCTGKDTVGAQIIKIIDKAPPVCVSSPEYKYTQETDEGKCTGTFIVPAPNVIFECSKYDYIVGYKLRDANGNQYTNPVYDNVVKTTKPDGTYFYTIKSLPADTSWIIYTITDACGNSSQCFNEVIVKDKESPSPVCEGFTVVSLDDAGWADLYAESVDDGSSDNCGVERFQIKRLENKCNRPADLNFGEKVNFCCEDVSSDPNVYQKVALRVFDKVGNFADCVANIKVQDKKTPKLTAPPAITIDCEVDYKNTAITGQATATDNCSVTITFTDSGTLKCGLGVITRTWKGTDKQGLFETKTQIITIKDSDPFGEKDITWPADLDINGCNKADATPEILNSKVVYKNSNCADIAISYDDEVFSIPGACLKILRTWRVINWCDANAQNPQFIIHVQKITMRNSEPPVVVSGCGNRTINSINSDCEEYAEHSITATDDCTPSALLKYTWAYDEKNNGTVDQTGVGSFYGRVYPAGKHKMTFTVKDQCENATTCSYIFTIKDNKAPTPICNAEVVWVLDEQGKAVVWASDFNLKSEDLCDHSNLTFSFNAAGNQPSKTFSCADVPNGVSASIPLKMYVFDSDGNSEFCDVKLILQDSPNKNVCPNTGNLTANISGKVINKLEEGFSNISVGLKNMNDESQVNSVTEVDGKFTFAEVPYFNGYLLNPTKKDDIMNGISTLDLVLIQRHILGAKSLENPYDIIAADINKDNKLTASDLVSLRKVILGIENSFPKNDPWRFVPSNHTFADPKNPFEFPGGIIMNELITDQPDINFTAVKVGDVNTSALYNANSSNSEPRTAPAFLLVNDQQFETGEKISVAIAPSEQMEIFGIQFAIEFDVNTMVFDGVQSGDLNISSENMHIDGNTIKFSSDLLKAINVNEGDVLFTLNFKAKKAGNLATLTLNSNKLSGELYDGELNVRKLNLEVGNSTESVQTSLVKSHPNPFSESTTIQLNAEESGAALLKIADAAGKIVYQSSTNFVKGLNKMIVNRNDLGGKAGVYFYQIENQGHVFNGKIILAH